jgi:hypothetical protein
LSRRSRNLWRESANTTIVRPEPPLDSRLGAVAV